MKNWIAEQMVANNEMKKLLKRIDNKKGKKLTIRMDQLEKLLNPSFKKIKDCIIIIDERAEETPDEHLDRIVEKCTDRTGYEASNTETRINCFFENKISMKTGTRIALLIIDIWAVKLKSLDPMSKFCIIMCSNKERVEIRFHKLREDEIMWLGHNVESYRGEAVGYVVI